MRKVRDIPSPSGSKEWFSITETADMTGQCKRTIERAINAGIIKAMKFPGASKWRIHRDWIIEYYGRGEMNDRKQ